MYKSTTIVSVRRDGKVAIGGDGQVTLGEAIVKHDANKIRKLLDGKVVVGFAGASADAFALLERFEGVLKDYQGNVIRAATELVYFLGYGGLMGKRGRPGSSFVEVTLIDHRSAPSASVLS